jgi:hypothetical protein
MDTGTCFRLTTDTAKYPNIPTIHANRSQVSPRSNYLTGKGWTSITYVISLGSFNNPSYKKMYINGKAESTTETTSVTNPCNPGNTNLYSPAYKLTITNEKPGRYAAIKDLKIFGSSLSPIELLMEVHRKGNPWKFMSYFRYHWPMNEYPYTTLYNHAVDHLYNIYSLYNPQSDTKPAAIDLTLDGAKGNWFWIDDPTLRCESYEFNHTKQGKCYPPNRALMFVRDYTHAIILQTGPVEKNFTVEFWINIAKEESGLQEIFKTQYFTISYQDSAFTFNIFNEVVLKDNGYKSVAKDVSALKKWTHIGVANVDLMDISSICVNGILKGSNSAVTFTGTMTAWTISDDTYGFTGMIRDLRIWNQYRGPGRIHFDMHIWQWDFNAHNFNLLGFYPLDEAHGNALNDHSSYNPTGLLNYRVPSSSLNSPYWARADTLPVLCNYNQIYDESTNSCRAYKKVLRVGAGVIELKTNKKMSYRDWSFFAWVKRNGVGNIIVDNLFTFTWDSDGKLTLKVNTATITSTELPIMAENTWYQVTVSYTYLSRKVYVECENAHHFKKKEELTSGSTIKTVRNVGEAFKGCYGNPSIKLSGGHFMHVSLWKKFTTRTRMQTNNDKIVAQYIDPYVLIITQ